MGGTWAIRATKISDSLRKVDPMMKNILVLAALGGLIVATSAVPADAAPRRAADGTEAAASTTQRSQSTRNRSASQGQKANRQNRSSSSNKANRNRAPRTSATEG
jgi:hypothetical protein